MRLAIYRIAATTAFLAVVSIAATASGQTHGGILKLYSPINPGNLSLLEEPTIGAEMPMMEVFNNLIMFDQHKKQVSLETIVPDLATSWEWNEDGTELTFQLRHGVKWHDGKSFTAQDVKCSWELRMGTAPEKLRLNFQKSALYNLASVTTNRDFEVSFHLKQPQPAFPMILAGGFAVITPCHLSPAELRQHPIGMARSNSSSSSPTNTSR